MDFERIFKFFKTCKNSYTGPFCTTDLQYGGHDKEIRNFCQFLSQTDIFWQNCRLTHEF
jgi:hypothetical protein